MLSSMIQSIQALNIAVSHRPRYMRALFWMHEAATAAGSEFTQSE